MQERTPLGYFNWAPMTAETLLSPTVQPYPAVTNPPARPGTPFPGLGLESEQHLQNSSDLFLPMAPPPTPISIGTFVFTSRLNPPFILRRLKNDHHPYEANILQAYLDDLDRVNLPGIQELHYELGYPLPSQRASPTQQLLSSSRSLRTGGYAHRNGRPPWRIEDGR